MNEDRPLNLRAAFHFHSAEAFSTFPASKEVQQKLAKEAIVRSAAYAIGWLLDRPKTHRQIMTFYSRVRQR
jgi:hypothetical protein